MSARQPSDRPSVASLIVLGSTVVVLVVGGVGLGWWLDSLLHTTPVFVFIGLATGMASAWLYAYAKLRKFLKQ
ncbi:putative F0F1-ATPase subunit (Ca2+/Mg2+ transporter) [Kutzneria buriramensis]|jgi:F0F1-type ATP synthase assembly protein I|uniref:Putative F0F1-ATPase subunit (Ca2+/Mg2+ transporter) n=1 Tax=Kutzneria buriramensis TaxID=1045776 RepID=A0A3E0HAD3_9PSEU|nr:putative F0F1-ATPase subunit (Ca2+/Mg2+ transporter) [Kutzneria buriramensis]